MRLLLLSPRQREDGQREHFLRIPQLALNVIAALTPEDVQIDLVEEETENIDFKKFYDLVGITVVTAVAPRAYKLAKVFREKGSKVVMGGIHPSVLPLEAIQYCDTVVIGEAEGCWGKLIEDFREGRLQRFYESRSFDLSKFPIPRRDFNQKKNAFNAVPILTTRGCPYDCEFCSVTNLYGRKLRHRLIENVVDEIIQTKGKSFIFLDDNIVGSVKYAKKLFQALTDLNIVWCGQSSIMSLIRDNELLRMAKNSGCKVLFFGLESVSIESLKRMRKSLKTLKEYEEAIKIVQDHGIMFHASVVFGFDEDEITIFEDTLGFLMKNRIPSVTFNILTPYPGTALYRRFEKEGRLITTDWSKYDHNTVVFKPRNMSVEALAEGHMWVKKNFYSPESIFGRFLANLNHPLYFLALNWGSYRSSRASSVKGCLPEYTKLGFEQSRVGLVH